MIAAIGMFLATVDESFVTVAARVISAARPRMLDRCGFSGYVEMTLHLFCPVAR